MLSRLRSPGEATLIGVATALGVYLIFNDALPSITDIRTANPHDDDIESARKAATVKSALLIGAVFLVARDVNSYVISGAALVGTDYLYKHANAVHPMTGKLDDSGQAASIAPGLATAYAMPSYSDSDDDS